MVTIRVKFKYKLLFTLVFILIISNVFLYSFDKKVTPTVLAVADAEMRMRSMDILNKTILEEYSKEFNYDEIIKVEKDKNDNIVMLKADTLKMNKISTTVSMKAQKELRDAGSVGIKVPMGYILNNNIFANIGPSITFKMQPLGYIETKYISDFEDAGINQTRHKIYVSIRTKIRVIIPMHSNEIEVKTEMPIAETIIVGKIPNIPFQFDLNGASLNNK